MDWKQLGSGREVDFTRESPCGRKSVCQWTRDRGHRQWRMPWSFVQNVHKQGGDWGECLKSHSLACRYRPDRFVESEKCWTSIIFSNVNGEEICILRQN